MMVAGQQNLTLDDLLGVRKAPSPMTGCALCSRRRSGRSLPRAASSPCLAAGMGLGMYNQPTPTHTHTFTTDNSNSGSGGDGQLQAPSLRTLPPLALARAASCLHPKDVMSMSVASRWLHEALTPYMRCLGFRYNRIPRRNSFIFQQQRRSSQSPSHKEIKIVGGENFRFGKREVEAAADAGRSKCVLFGPMAGVAENGDDGERNGSNGQGQTVKALSLVDGAMGDEELKSLADAIEYNGAWRELESLRLGDVDALAASVLMRAIGSGHGCPRLRRLVMYDWELKPGLCGAVAQALHMGAFPVLEELRLEACAATDDEVKDLVRSLGRQPAGHNHPRPLRVLKLGEGYFGAEGVSAIAASMGVGRACHGLHSLDLSGSEVGDDGVMVLARAIEAGAGPQLREVKLHDALVSPRAMAVLEAVRTRRAYAGLVGSLWSIHQQERQQQQQERMQHAQAHARAHDGQRVLVPVRD